MKKLMEMEIMEMEMETTEAIENAVHVNALTGVREIKCLVSPILMGDLLVPFSSILQKALWYCK